MCDKCPDISIVYYKNSFNVLELNEIETELAKCDLQIVSSERSSYINASIDFFIPFIEILLSPKTASDLCSGLLSNATWDAIMALLTRIFRKFCKKPVTKLQHGNITEESANIHFIIGNNTLVLPTNVDEVKFKYVVDQFIHVSALSNPSEITYNFCPNKESCILQKTEADIIKEEYEKQQKAKIKGTGGKKMATNPPSGDGHRNGAVKQRSQTYNPKTGTWTKRDTNTGKFIDGKKDGTPFKGVRKEK